MNAQIRCTAARHPTLVTAWEQLQVHYDTHQKSASFWTAYQEIQDALTDAHPERRIDVCNPLATLAEPLGVVAHAQLRGERCAGHVSQGRYAGSTP